MKKIAIRRIGCTAALCAVILTSACTKKGGLVVEPSVVPYDEELEASAPASTKPASPSEIGKTEAGGYVIKSSDVGSSGVLVGENGSVQPGEYFVSTEGRGVFGVLKEGEKPGNMTAEIIGHSKGIGEGELINKYYELKDGDKIFITSSDPEGLAIRLEHAAKVELEK